MGTMEADIFKEEAYDLLDDIEAALLELKDAPADRELINRLFRAFHTIKGSGAMFGFKAVAEFTHHIETAIDKIREGSGVFPDELSETLLMGRDQILRMIEAPDPDEPEIQEGAQLILAQLGGITGKGRVAAAPPPPQPQPEKTVAAPLPPAAAPPSPPPPPTATTNQGLIDEMGELLAEVRQMLQELRAKPDSAKLQKKLHRALHTVEGTSSMYDLEVLADFSGKLAATADAVKESGQAVSGAMLDGFEMAMEHCLALLRTTAPAPPVLQRRAAKIAAELDAMLPGRATAAATQAKQIKVLIVEDEFISRYLLQEFLTPYGSSHVAIDGYEAILAFKNALIEKKPYDLVCLDIMMPGLDGRQVAKEIRRLESEMGNGISCKVVMTTALDDVKIKGEMLAAHHCDAYLTKPLRFDELIELLKKYFPAALPAEMLG